MKKVFIIHGWTYTLDAWAAILEELKRVQLEPVMLKVPGLTTPSKMVWNIDGYTDWLAEQLKDQTKPIVIGHSNGGRIALAFAQRYPNRLGQLILIGSAGIAHTDSRTSLKLKVLRRLAKLGKPLTVLPLFKKIVYKVIGAQDYFNAPPNMKRTMQNMLAADKNINISKLNLPVTLIWGREDKITPLADGEKLVAGIAGAKLNIIDDARHSPYATQPKKVAAIIQAAVEANK